MRDTLLVELLTEELPPKALKLLSDTFCNEVLNGLIRHHLKQRDPSGGQTFATPRRLAVLVPDVLAKADDQHSEVSGPSLKIGLDPESKPTPALVGFARKNGVAVESLEQRETPKGKVFVAHVNIAGSKLDAVLAAIVEDSLKKLPIPKMMRWGAGDAQFVRPVHGMVMVHGSRVVPGQVLGLESSNQTQGHRFLSHEAITIKHAGDYEQVLRDEGKVVASFDGRRKKIINQLNEIAGEGVALVASDALFDEITALVEAPTVYAGEFSPGFLEVPEECLVLSMQQHQKYVPLRDQASGKLLPRFLFVSNLKADNPSSIIRGNERVLRARLSDARFFYDQDRKTRLEARVPRLANVVYHNKLGNQLERVERIQLLAGRIARDIAADPLLAERAAWLTKADLLTDMVGEFPELQGIMGRYYALHDGEPKDVANAIDAHYRPRFAGDALPDRPIACAVALADRLDALAGLFGIGQVPTGDKDPFGLRRSALGVIRILIERDLSLSLRELVGAAFAGYGKRVAEAHTDLESFVFDRLAGYLRDRGYSSLEVESVVSLRPVQINLVPRQVEAVRAFNALPEAESLAAANKRVVNILKQAAAKGESFMNAEAKALKEPAERALFDALKTAALHATSLFNQGDFTGYLKTFAVLKSPVDAFFDSVMVMADAPELRRNRLALLADLRREMNRVADISKLAA
jgi:glycyl-tRNA synthetase beta chain